MTRHGNIRLEISVKQELDRIRIEIINELTNPNITHTDAVRRLIEVYKKSKMEDKVEKANS